MSPALRRAAAHGVIFGIFGRGGGGSWDSDGNINYIIIKIRLFWLRFLVRIPCCTLSFVPIFQNPNINKIYYINTFKE